MVAYEVSVNGRRLCLAGVGEEGVLSAIISRASGQGRQTDHNLHVGGYANGEHARWLDTQIAIGDLIQVRVVDAESVDEPVTREPEDPEFVAKAEREYFEQMRKKYGDG